jgi:hypothetical protein
LATGTTNEFNALCNLSPAMMLRLEILAFQGPSPVSNAFTQEADRLGLTPLGRERIEREDRKKFADRLEALRRQAEEFRKTLDLLEQATAEALRENDEHLRAAREELRRIQDRAYEVTMPDGTVAKVYRDGDKVRSDDGAEVGRQIVHPDELPSSSPSWQRRKGAGDSVTRLENERAEIIDYQDRLTRSKNTLSADDVTTQQLDAMQADAARMPEAVRRHYGPQPSARTAIELPDAVASLRALNTDVRPTRDFNAAPQLKVSDPLLAADLPEMPPSVSAPAPR